MNDVILALVPAFLAGLAVQQFLDLIVDPLLQIVGKEPKDQKMIVYGVISMLLGAGLAFAGVRVFEPLKQSQGGFRVPWMVDIVVTALIISGGTQSFNSILKFLNAAKEGKKAEAKNKKRQRNDTP